MAGAPFGNQNAKKAKRYQKAIERALATAVGASVDDGLDKVAAQLVLAALAGEQWALRELGDRIDGKPAQVITGDADGDPIRTTSEIVLRGVSSVSAND